MKRTLVSSFLPPPQGSVLDTILPFPIDINHFNLNFLVRFPLYFKFFMPIFLRPSSCLYSMRRDQPPTAILLRSSYHKVAVYINHWCCLLLHLMVCLIHNLQSHSNILNTFRSDDSLTFFIPAPFVPFLLAAAKKM